MKSAEDKSMFYALLVDDVVSSRRALAEILCAYFPSVAVEEAGNGTEALRKVDYLRPNIIFMDIQMPGKNGLELTKEIKRVYGNIKIVVVSANNLPEYRQQAFQNGADCYISKADDACIEKILTQVEEAMGKRGR
jgi:two-component system response regulator YesN